MTVPAPWSLVLMAPFVISFLYTFFYALVAMSYQFSVSDYVNDAYKKRYGLDLTFTPRVMSEEEIGSFFDKDTSEYKDLLKSIRAIKKAKRGAICVLLSLLFMFLVAFAYSTIVEYLVS